MTDDSSVQVAVRIRPLVDSEISKGCQDILEVYPELEQIRIKNSDKAFTYNHVLDSNSTQAELYNRCSSNLIGNLFKGYNVTILAYGQTGSGKTFSMGTCYKGEDEMGVIPRAVFHIFEKMRDFFSYDFTLTVSFMELYQESLYDLLSEKPRDQSQLDIREDASKGIVLQGLTNVSVKTPDEILACLTKGSLGRATGATNMNAQSSRSHAIFIINITMHNRNDLTDRKSAKFTLVDLAGSERSKKTGAVGVTFKEGVNINKGLLVLGNVISALGDEKQQHGFIPYRDSNLTRLLKDSLGGNSFTLMIACVSPADFNVEETISTLRYADRARKIRNKPVINQDSKAAEIIELKKTIQQLKLQILGQDTGNSSLCSDEINTIKKENAEQKEKIRHLTFQLSSVLNENTGLLEKMLLLQSANENLKNRITDLKDDYETTFNNLSIGIENPEQIKANLEKLEVIKRKIFDIDSEQKETENEVRKHESTFTVHHSGKGKEEPSEEAEITEKQAFFTNKQMALKSELETISARLAMKESLASQLQSNVQQMANLSLMRETEDKISQLEQEKNELLQQLRNAHREPSPKISEQRRKRVQELETELQSLKKKIQQQAKLIKLKEKDELNIKRLNTEIVSMKQEKVKLIRNMREESDRFRVWKQQRERELAKLKQEDRKKQNQIQKMEVMHTKQQNVLKRKVEEFSALNKRLNKTLHQRKLVQEQRLGGKIEKIGDWLKHEVEVCSNIIEVENALSDLLEDRAMLQQQLDKLRQDTDNCDERQIKTLQEEIEVRSLQIQDSQQKILDFSEDSNKARTRWDNIQSMAEAKIALKTLWQMIADIKKSEVVSLSKNSEISSRLEELNSQVEKLSKENDMIIEKHAEEISCLEKDYGEKVCLLLKRLEGKATNDDLEKIILLEREENKKLKQECATLNEKLCDIMAALEEKESKENDLHKTPENIPKRSILKKPKANNLSSYPDGKENELNISDNIDFEEDDPDKDPDWRKTPMGKRVFDERRKIRVAKSILMTDHMGIKRSLDGGCTCQKGCTNRCGCIKSTKKCSSSCKCPGDCKNRSNEEENNSQSDSDGDTTSELKKSIFSSGISKLPKRAREASKFHLPPPV